MLFSQWEIHCLGNLQGISFNLQRISFVEVHSANPTSLAQFPTFFHLGVPHFPTCSNIVHLFFLYFPIVSECSLFMFLLFRTVHKEAPCRTERLGNHVFEIERLLWALRKRTPVLICIPCVGRNPVSYNYMYTCILYICMYLYIYLSILYVYTYIYILAPSHP